MVFIARTSWEGRGRTEGQHALRVGRPVSAGTVSGPLCGCKSSNITACLGLEFIERTT